MKHGGCIYYKFYVQYRDFHLVVKELKIGYQRLTSYLRTQDVPHKQMSMKELSEKKKKKTPENSPLQVA